MSKGNMLLGHARGKVGDLVFSRANGAQITKARTTRPKNPRTTAQILQRVFINTVAQAYSTMQPICDHSFEGVQVGNATMSAFMSQNVKNLRSRIAALVNAGGDIYTEYSFTPLGTNVFAPNQFLIAKGTLPEVVPTFGTIGDLPRTQLTVGGTTYADVIRTLGLSRGDQLTFVQLTRRNDQAVFNYARVILDPTIDGASADLSTPFIVEGAINAPSVRNSGEFGFLNLADGVLSYDLMGSATTASQVMCAAVIVSRKTAGGYKRSTSYLQLNDAVVTGYGYSLGQCLDMGAEGLSTFSDEYLNNAGQGAVVNGSTSSAAAISQVTVNGTRLSSGVQAIIEVASDETPLTVELITANATGMYAGVMQSIDGRPFPSAVEVGSDGRVTITVPGTTDGQVWYIAISSVDDSTTFAQNIVARYSGTFVTNIGD